MAKLSEYTTPEIVSLQGLLDSLVTHVTNTNPYPVLFDLGCGENKAPGFQGVDFYADTDVQHDLFRGNWSFTPDNSVDVFYSSHFVEHVPDWNRFWANVYNKLAPGGFILVTHPYGASVRAHQDPDHKQIIFQERYWYVNKAARDKMKVGHYLHDNDGNRVFMDFDIVDMWPVFNERFADLGEAQKSYHLHHTWNAVADVTVLLKKRPAEE
jgi:predicted SAM-dependent methyltransferase